MHREAAEAAQAVRTQLAANRERLAHLAAELRRLKPRAVVTCARGSSDHAATFAKYLIETRAGVLTASAAPSVSSVYEAVPDLRSTIVLAISQSGSSPDLVSFATRARAAGAGVVALVNVPDSPLAACADHVVPLCAAPETSVAATKSYIASLAAIVHLVAEWTADHLLLEALAQLPAQLERAWKLDWSATLPVLVEAQDLYVIGRGLGLSLAQEAALKLKETCGLHAEAFSAAELQHGPITLVKPGFPVMLFAQDDETCAGSASLADELQARGAQVLLAGLDRPGACVLPTVRAPGPIEPLLMAQSFYRLANALAIARGFDPDRPPHLRKITETL